MSFVSIIATKKFITVMSDGQVTKSGKVLEENYQKFVKISPKQFIAFTGAKEICESLAGTVEYREDAHDLETVANQILSVSTVPELKKFKLHFGIGGIDANGEILFYTVQNQSDSPIGFYKPSNEDDISYAFFESGYINTPISLDDLLINSFKKIGFNTPNKCLRTQKILNDFVASHDSTVNKVTFNLTIKI